MIDLCLTSIQLTIMFVWYKVGLIGIKRGIRGLPCVSDSNSGLHQCCPTPKCRLFPSLNSLSPLPLHLLTISSTSNSLMGHWKISKKETTGFTREE